MEEDGYKEVYFNEYCESCRYKDLDSENTPCYECLGEPVNLNSHKPVKYVEKNKG